MAQIKQQLARFQREYDEKREILVANDEYLIERKNKLEKNIREYNEEVEAFHEMKKDYEAKMFIDIENLRVAKAKSEAGTKQMRDELKRKLIRGIENSFLDLEFSD